MENHNVTLRLHKAVWMEIWRDHDSIMIQWVQYPTWDAPLAAADLRLILN